MKILITGSSGFIGSSLRDLLEKKDIEIIPYDIKDKSMNDVRNYQRLESYFRDMNGIIHLAAISRVKLGYENPLDCIQTNIGGTINVLEAARLHKIDDKYPWVIYGSSREVYGEPNTLPVTENSPRNSINIYGVSKVTGEDLCKIYSQHYSLTTRILRFSNVYTGKNDHLDRVIPKFIFQALKNEDLVINGTGEELFDFTYIEDTIKGIWGCIQEIEDNKKLFDDYNLSTGIPVSLMDLAKLIIKKVGSKSQIKFTKARSYDVNRFYANPIKAKKILNFSPSIMIEEGLELAINELKDL